MKLTFEQRARAEDLLAAAIDDPECAATRLVHLESQLAEARHVLGMWRRAEEDWDDDLLDDAKQRRDALLAQEVYQCRGRT